MSTVNSDPKLKLLDLPEACHVIILSYLPVQDVLRLSRACQALCDLARDPVLWRGIAVHKWGWHVPEAVSDGDWRAWCCHRMSFKEIRSSPFNLLQESYPDPWQHITACVLCSRTSGGEIIRSTVARFFECFPTPSHVLDASKEVLSDLIHPLGLQPTRVRAVQEIASGFLNTQWSCPSEFYGCGKFVSDSWRVFCKGDVTGKGVEDQNLKRYLAFLRQPIVPLEAGTVSAINITMKSRSDPRSNPRSNPRSTRSPLTLNPVRFPAWDTEGLKDTKVNAKKARPANSSARKTSNWQQSTTLSERSVAGRKRGLPTQASETTTVKRTRASGGASQVTVPGPHVTAAAGRRRTRRAAAASQEPFLALQ